MPTAAAEGPGAHAARYCITPGTRRPPAGATGATGAMGATGVTGMTAASRLAGLRLPSSSPSAQA